jgi:peptide/nickel transport system permease protein
MWSRGLRRLRRDRLTLIALTLMTLLTLASVGAPLITGALGLDPNETDPSRNFLPIGTPGHPLGTDNLGRDQLARLLYAGRVSLSIGFFGAVIALAIGLTFGMAAGYLGGAFDSIMNWIITTIDSVPSLFLLVLISSVLTPSASTLVIVVALTGWTGTTRFMRGQTLRLRNMEYILGARAIGASSLRVMFAHILPNLFSFIVIGLAGSVGGLILGESSISFLGLGVLPPEATWGNMLSNAQQMFRRGPHMLFMPGLMIFITVLCLYIIGDGLRDAFDPKAKNE